MKKPQYLTIAAGCAIICLIFIFGRTILGKKDLPASETGHQSPPAQQSNAVEISVDTILVLAEKSLNPAQNKELKTLQQQLTTASKDQKTVMLHQLADFWRLEGKSFTPFAWYTAENARLENSEKKLTFAGQLFLNRLQQEEDVALKRWMALQSKDLFERSLKINPDNDSTKIGLGATYLFGGISASPMEGIAKVREVLAKDSNNVYGQMMLATASLMSNQPEKAIQRLETVHKIQPKNLQAVLMLGDIFERMHDKANAVKWYRTALPLIQREDIKKEVEQRITELNK